MEETTTPEVTKETLAQKYTYKCAVHGDILKRYKVFKQQCAENEVKFMEAIQLAEADVDAADAEAGEFKLKAQSAEHTESSVVAEPELPAV